MVTGKGVDVLDNLEKVQFNGNYLPINYYNKYGTSIERPQKLAVADGITAESVLKSFINNTGVNIADINALQLVYKGEFMQMSIKVEETYSDKEQKQVISVGGNAMMTSVVSQDSAYIKQGPNQTDLPKAIHDDLKKTLAVLPEIGLLESQEATLEGIVNINGSDAYEIKTQGVGVTFTSYYDVNTGLRVRESSLINFNGQMQTNTTDYSDYSEQSGLILAGKKSFNLGGQDISLTLDKAEINPEK